MPRKTKTIATADKVAQPQFSAELLEQLIPGRVTPAERGLSGLRRPTMRTNHDHKPLASKGKRSSLRIVANLAWLFAASSVLAPIWLDLSASGRDAANALFGLAFFVFFLCAIAGLFRAAKHRRVQENAAMPKDPKHSSDSE